MKLDRRIWQLAFARTVNTMGLSLVMTFLGIYVVETRGYPAWLYGVIALCGNFAQSLSNAWAGQLSDRIGRKPLITRSLVVRSVFIALLGVQVLLDSPIWALAANLVIDAIGDHHGATWLIIPTLGLVQVLYLFAFVRRR